MTFDFSRVDELLKTAIGVDAPAAQLVVLQEGRPVFAGAYGWLDPDTHQKPADLDTLFDMASVTKLFTTTCFMRLMEAGRVGLDQPVSSLLPDFSGLRSIHPYEDPLKNGEWIDVNGGDNGQVDAGKITFRQLLTHSSGLPAWRLFKDQPDAESARRLALDTFFSYRPGERVVYSDVGLILLGMAVEVITGLRLDEAIYAGVTRPLQLARTRFLPVGEVLPALEIGNIAPTEYCKWRQRRIRGEVHDESSWRMGGIAGHAGIFSTAGDTARLGQMYLDGGRPLLKPETVAEMLRLQSEYQGTRRGLGFALWSPDPEASSNPFSQSAFGHTGFTGTELWMDPQRKLVVSFLTNEVYNGREGRTIGELRLKLHRAILAAVDNAQALEGNQVVRL
ncbi:beta-lactamase class C and other penicillin binding proteins [Longilinea arvoryzae]|uniref:Beta-lactamase class C and other penicillin binding proteins n=1 Tax=Longilinea arvoryzae TaxID=360412 RepID=A0A0S7BFF9_9CHLR|nr:serine hydrolase [Longilinea arvoryzae]GAP13744.1 beta-lactamase class C and other penicillin binding proteins [Longilinea arvoryzae]